MAKRKRAESSGQEQSEKQLTISGAGGSAGVVPNRVPRPGDASRPEPRASEKPAPTRQLAFASVDTRRERHSWTLQPAVLIDGVEAPDHWACRWCGLVRFDGRYLVRDGTVAASRAPRCHGVPLRLGELPGEGDERTPGRGFSQPGVAGQSPARVLLDDRDVAAVVERARERFKLDGDESRTLGRLLSFAGRTRLVDESLVLLAVEVARGMG